MFDEESKNYCRRSQYIKYDSLKDTPSTSEEVIT